MLNYHRSKFFVNAFEFDVKGKVVIFFKFVTSLTD
jgi:hypothetical protein